MPSADTMTLLDEANVAAVRLMVRELASHDLIEVFQAACGRAPIARLSAVPMQSRGLDF